MGEVITAYGQEVGLCYWDGSAWQKLESDTLSATAQLYYWDGSAWQKYGQEQILGFESTCAVYVVDSSLDLGYNELYGTAVGAGKVQKITVASFVYVGTPPTYVRLVAIVAGKAVVLKNVATVTSGYTYTWSGEVYLDATRYLYLATDGATAGDDLYLRYAGIQMDAP